MFSDFLKSFTHIFIKPKICLIFALFLCKDNMLFAFLILTLTRYLDILLLVNINITYCCNASDNVKYDVDQTPFWRNNINARYFNKFSTQSFKIFSDQFKVKITKLKIFREHWTTKKLVTRRRKQQSFQNNSDLTRMYKNLFRLQYTLSLDFHNLFSISF